MKKNSLLAISEEGFHHIAYTEWGIFEPELPTVICVHGYTRNSRDFDELANYLSSKGRHVFCPDIAGRGDSSWFKNPRDYNFTQYVKDMTVLMARTNAHQIDWIGTSMGGIIGMILAAMPNSPINKLVLNDIGPQIPIHGLRRIAKYAGKDPDFKNLEEAKQHFKASYADFGITNEKQWDIFTKNSVEQRGPNLYVTKMDPAIKKSKSILQIISEFFRHPHKALEGIFYDINLWSIWKQIECPVLVIHGVNSDILTSEIITQMKKTHALTEVYEVENAGHAPALLDLTVHQRIEDWLATHQ
ncbi:alpha/beta hydrolase [Legionella pneumophila]|uniref:alpha/beta fold hydrolase n=1 Tax=Legionella pneumophila TaxID=446 RepID=UPI000488A7F3|nr:alpha/beta hydrolase [Legionella pneumophila]RYW87648.1 alpha/beta hydrolase [Legionella pneumophila]STX99331.1 hydrolase [Legionella pneumophila]HAT1776385.1 alpha/beta hydrolase [Legionella pneumophila]HAT1779368.1 alpha/beta hydrolase [Legionella pneumophila]HAT2019692.1 alpha/beta hydrolase [Legionella pneumophila]